MITLRVNQTAKMLKQPQNIIWIAIKVGFRYISGDVKASKTLKGLCDETNCSYATANRRKKEAKDFLIQDKAKSQWFFIEVQYVTIEGRGDQASFYKNRN